MRGVELWIRCLREKICRLTALQAYGNGLQLMPSAGLRLLLIVQNRGFAQLAPALLGSALLPGRFRQAHCELPLPSSPDVRIDADELTVTLRIGCALGIDEEHA